MSESHVHDDEDHVSEWDDDTKVVTTGERPTLDPGEYAYLIVIGGSQVGTMVRIEDDLVVGRGRETDLQTLDEGVSRQHARIRVEEGGLTVSDLGSRNGTFVNGERVETHRLQDGDKIQIGTTTILKFSYADRIEETFQQQMYDAAIRDPLTLIFNRRHFDEQLRSEFSYCSRHGLPLSLIMMDLDHFKQVNDTHGHPAGDAVLKGVAEILAHSTREEDLFARYGGEEFALLCRGISGPVSFSIANRIRRLLESSSLVPSLPELKVTLSAGVAALPDPGLGTSTELVAAADRALYQAKAMGRNRICIYDADLDPPAPAPDGEPAGEGEVTTAHPVLPDES